MSVRIYELSQKIGMENSTLINLLKERGFQVRTASSSIDNISAESLIEEFLKEKEPSSQKQTKTGKKKESSDKKQETPKVLSSPPEGSVKTKMKADLENQKETKHPKKDYLAPTAPPLPTRSPKSVSPPSVPRVSATKNTTSKTPKSIHLKGPIVVRDFAAHLKIKPFRLISELMEQGIFASMNQIIEEETAKKIADKYNVVLEIRHRGEQVEKKQKKQKKSEIQEIKQLEPRPPVVCILGHVDHGKTTLLDTIRKTHIVKTEAGGITQHIGAYQIQHQKQKITFIDTPGHAAFSKMRERGATVTDIVVLVVAADDGFMPQTDEALNYAKALNVPVIVAINKIDSKGANQDRVKKQMQERNITPEDWGGETITVPISALKNENIDNLLEMIMLQSEIMELKADTQCPPQGMIIETQKEIGRGATASVIVQKGTLKVGESLVCGTCYSKVKILLDDQKKPIKKAPPSTPVKVVSWSGTPESGTIFKTVKDERTAKQQAEQN
jgi:translation initiation factor IF-2